MKVDVPGLGSVVGIKTSEDLSSGQDKREIPENLVIAKPVAGKK